MNRPSRQAMRGLEPWRRIAAVTICIGTVLFIPARVHAEGGRVTGVVVDESGKPVNGIQVRFVSDAEQGTHVAPANVKNGKFVVASFPGGSFRVEIDDAAGQIKHFTLEIRGADGSRLGKIDSAIPTGATPPPFQVGESQRASLTLVVGSPLADAYGRATGVKAARATSTALATLNELFTKGDMNGLLAQADAALAKDPGLGGAVYLRAVALWKLGRPGDAEEAMRRAAELVPDQPGIEGVHGQILLDLGGKQMQEGKEDQARETFSQAAAVFGRQIEKDPGDLGALTNRVIAFDRAGRKDETLAALGALKAKSPDDPKVHLRTAEILLDANRPEEALSVLEQMPGADSKAVLTMYNAGVKLYNAGKMEEVVSAMQRAVRIAPEVPHPHQLLAKALMAKGDFQGAAKELAEFLRLAPDDPDAPAERELLKRLK